MIAVTREKALRSQHEVLRDLMGNCSQEMKMRLLHTKRRHLKQVRSYIKHRKKAEKTINKSFKKGSKDKTRRKDKKCSEGTGSVDDISSVCSEGSVKKETEVIWKDIEPLEGLFSLV